MLIGITADLHFPTTPLHKIEEIARNLAKQKPDVVAILGDIGEGLQPIIDCLTIFKENFPSTPILALPGNHDLWVYPFDKQYGNSFDRLKILSQKAKEMNIHWLEDHNKYIDNIAFVGSYLHYDYSAKDKVGPYQFEDEYYQQNKINVNNDAIYLQGIPSDKEFAKMLGDKFLLRLSEANKSEKIVVLTHVPCMEEQIKRRPYDADWSLGTPYFGNLSYEDTIRQNQKIKLIVSGHSHQWARVDFPQIIINLDSDYRNPNGILIEI